MTRFSHLTDDTLLRVIDGELAPRRQRRARQHLAGCSICQARLACIEQTLAGVLDAHGTDTDRPLPPPAPARARLAARMARESSQPPHWLDRLAVPSWTANRPWLYGAAVLLLALATGLLLQAQRRPFTGVAPDAAGIFLLPRADLTPGAAAPVALHDMCDPGRERRTEPIPRAVQEAIFARYGADYRRADEYELDYLITPELGGVVDERNLWPQPFARTPWNAYVKDELERLLHQRVCAGDLDLATAQREMASDWISAYKHYFNTERPLRDYEAAPLTALDSDLILSELEELGVSPPAVARRDGAALLAMLRSAREESHAAIPKVRLEWAAFRPAP